MKLKLKKRKSSDILEPEELAEMIPTLILMEAWTKDFRSLLLQQLEEGVQISGARMEEKENIRRFWGDLEDPEGISEELISYIRKAMKASGKPCKRKDVAPEKVLSPAGAEKILGRATFAKLLSGKVEKRTTSITTSLKLS